jgi:hypothetical protein
MFSISTHNCIAGPVVVKRKTARGCAPHRQESRCASRLSAFGILLLTIFGCENLLSEAFKNLLLRNFIAHFFARFIA